jgi:phage gpG-like protein
MATLSQLLTRLNDTDGLLDELGPFLIETIESGFKLEQDPSGEPWVALTPAHVERKNRAGARSGILRFNDHLFRSIRYQKRGNSVVAGPDDSIVYHRIHHKGGEIVHPSGAVIRMPARPYVGLGAAHLESMREQIVEYYFGGL